MPNAAMPKTYSAFWHLEAAGVLSRGPMRSAVWEALGAAPGALVALIDTGVEPGHPYLDNLDVALSLDLSGEPASAHGLPGTPPRPFRQLANPGIGGEEGAWLDAVLARHRDSVPYDLGGPGTMAMAFADHGTACAGLVVASPAAGGTPPYLPYVGVDPFSRLFSVTTSLEAAPERLILAVLYAAAQNADVILMPRGMPRALLAPRTGDPAGDAGTLGWRALRAVILAVSRAIPVVCAAGNEAETDLAAPAALADAATWGENGVIAVGAMNFNGQRASYSGYGRGLTLVAPSEDAEMLSRDQARIDWTNPENLLLPLDAAARRGGLDEAATPFAEQGVLAIEPTGRFDPGRAGQPQFRAGPGDFSLFGGTSAAASIVAGVAALMQRKAKAAGGRLTGPALKARLAATARRDNPPHLDPPSGRLKPDRINDTDLDFAAAFGAGLVDAAAALA